VLIGVEWHGASLNAVIPTWPEVQKIAEDVAKVAVPKMVSMGITDIRAHAKSFVMDEMHADKHLENRAVLSTLIWLALSDPRIAEPLQKMKDGPGELRPSEIRYVITDVRPGEFNWRLCVKFGDAAQPPDLTIDLTDKEK
jgi:hypothetical protein